MRAFRCLLLTSLLSGFAFGQSSNLAVQNAFPAAPGINALGLDLYREQVRTRGTGNILLSPYSIASALAMTSAGAAGVTEAEMRRVLHLPGDAATTTAAFRSLTAALARTVADAEQMRHSDDAPPFELKIANRLFAQQGYRPATSTACPPWKEI